MFILKGTDSSGNVFTIGSTVDIQLSGDVTALGVSGQPIETTLSKTLENPSGAWDLNFLDSYITTARNNIGFNYKCNALSASGATFYQKFINAADSSDDLAINFIQTIGQNSFFEFARGTDSLLNIKTNAVDVFSKKIVNVSNGTSTFDAVNYGQFSTALLKYNNLSDLTDATTARQNLGLTNIATQSVTLNAMLFGGSSDSIQSVPAPTDSNKLLISVADTLPVWSAFTFPLSTTENSLLYSSSANVIAGLATLDNGVLITNASGTPSISTTLPSAVQSSITGVGTVTSGTWNGSVVGVEYGGTGTSSLTAYRLLASGTGTTSAISTLAFGEIGQYLKSNGSGAYPSWATFNSVSSVAVSGSTGISVSGSPITSAGTISLTLSSELQGVSSLGSTGVVVRTAAGAYTTRALTAGTGISVTNGNGLSGNPTIALSGITLTGAVTGSGTSSIVTSLAPEQTVNSLAFPSISTLYVGNNSTNTGAGSGTLNVNLGGSVNNTQINLNFNYANSPAGQFIQYTFSSVAYFKFRYSGLDFWTTDYVGSDPRFKILQKLDVNSKNIINVATPILSTDAANKTYVDTNFYTKNYIDTNIPLKSEALLLGTNTSSATSFSYILNNTNASATVTGFSLRKSGVDKGQIGFNNSTNELYLWATNSSAIKFGTENVERINIGTDGVSQFYGRVRISGGDIYNNTLYVTRTPATGNTTDCALYLRGYYSGTTSYYDAAIDPAKYVHNFGQITYTRGSKRSLVIDTNANNESSSIALNGDYVQFINPLDDLGIIFTDEDSANSDSYVSYISSSGSLVVSSSNQKKYSIRKKEHKNYLDRINSLNVYSYAYKCNVNDSDDDKIRNRKYFKNKRLNVGLVAEEVEQLFENSTDKYKLIDIDNLNKDDFINLTKNHSIDIEEKDYVDTKNLNRDGPGIRYDTMLCYTILALQELSKKFDKLTSTRKLPLTVEEIK